MVQATPWPAQADSSAQLPTSPCMLAPEGGQRHWPGRTHEEVWTAEVHGMCEQSKHTMHNANQHTGTSNATNTEACCQQAYWPACSEQRLRVQAHCH